MCLALQIFLIIFLIQEKGIGNNYAQPAAVSEESEGYCEIAFSFARQGYLHPRSTRSFAYLAGSEGASFQRSSFFYAESKQLWRH